MAQKDTDRISHDISEAPVNTFRETKLAHIVDELDEESQGKGYTEVVRTGVFVTKITVWEDDQKLKKRTETLFARTGPFVSQIVKNFYSTDGLSIASSVTATFTRDGNNFMQNADIQIARP